MQTRIEKTNQLYQRVFTLAHEGWSVAEIAHAVEYSVSYISKIRKYQKQLQFEGGLF